MQFSFEQLVFSPGSEIVFDGISWQQFEHLLTNTGNHRLTYNKGLLKIMVPSAEHEYDKKLLANLLETLLDTLELEFIGLGSVTLKQSAYAKGAEPDECYYIKNAEKIRGKSRIDLQIDPPPDLVVEVDISSKTDLTIYQALGVPEVWLYTDAGLSIYRLENTGYQFSETSLLLPVLGLNECITQLVERSKKTGRSVVMQEFKAWLALKLNKSI
jgi:Uma2 family endonuclease